MLQVIFIVILNLFKLLEIAGNFVKDFNEGHI